MAKRYAGIDALRGLCLVSMLGYHGIYDLIYLFHWELNWFFASWVAAWQQITCWLFILIAGAMWNLGRHPWRRGSQLLLVGLALTGVTYFFVPQELIVFGIISFLGLAILAAASLRAIATKLVRYHGQGLSSKGRRGLLLFCVVGFVITESLAKGGLYLGGEGITLLPFSWYETGYFFWLGLPSPQFSSADYFPFFPWFFVFSIGTLGWQDICHWPCWQWGLPLLSWSGRHSLGIYLGHQPLLVALLTLLL